MDRVRHLLAVVAIVSFAPSQVFAQPIALQVAEVQTSFDEASREGLVTIRLDRDSARAFAMFTREHVQKTIDVLIDGEVAVTPIIREPIVSGMLSISELKGLQATETLAARLRSGDAVVTVAPAN